MRREEEVLVVSRRWRNMEMLVEGWVGDGRGSVVCVGILVS